MPDTLTYIEQNQWDVGTSVSKNDLWRRLLSVERNYKLCIVCYNKVLVGDKILNLDLSAVIIVRWNNINVFWSDFKFKHLRINSNFLP